MKNCPTCNRTFEDTFTFCLVDGSILSAPYNPQATPLNSANNDSSSQPTLLIHSTPMPERKSRRTGWILAGLFTLLIGAVITILGVRYFSRNNANRPEKTPSSNAVSNKNGESNVSQDSSLPAGQQSLEGTWKGTYGPSNRPATLLIQEDQDGKFSGILEQGDARVAFTGNLAPDSKQVTIKETKVLSGGGDGWSLGENKGELSADGRKMSGTGQDAVGAQIGMSYEWSFSKQ